jgi:hypothetical protein
MPDFRGMMNDVHNGRLGATATVIDAVTPDQRENYGFHESWFPTPSSEGRVTLLLSIP